jgi:Na+-driven multidrug efflux pump
MKLIRGAMMLALSQGFSPSRPFSARLRSAPERKLPSVLMGPHSFQQPKYWLNDTCSSTFIHTDANQVDLEAEIVITDEMIPYRKSDFGNDVFYVNTKTHLDRMCPSETAIADAALSVQKSGFIGKEVTASLSTILAASEAVAVAAHAKPPTEIVGKVEFVDLDGTIDGIHESDPLDFSSNDSIISLEDDAAIAEKIAAPRVSKIVRFAIPAIGVWLCSPLLSLIDTSCVGLMSGTIQQAALGPAVAVTDYSALLIAFLYTATTNLVSAARESDRNIEGKPRTTNTFVGAMQLSTYVGAGLGAILFVFARPLLRAIIGNDAIGPDVFEAAMRYVRIRAVGIPAAAVVGSAQCACLGMQDTRSPLYVLGVAAGVNFLLNLLFVGNSNPWIGGAAGVAWATIISQYAALGMFLHWLGHKGKPRRTQSLGIDVNEAIFDPADTRTSAGKSRPNPKSLEEAGEYSSPRSGDDENVSVRGFLENRFRTRDVLKVPSMDTIKKFAEYVVPVTSTQVGRVSGYVAMSHVVSSSLGTVSMAAQQIIVSLFYCITPIADSLNLTAQSFVPAIVERKPSVERATALRLAGINFAKAGVIFGAIMGCVASFIPLMSRFFTSDVQVASLVTMVTPLLMAVICMTGFVCSMEGVLLGQKDLNFLGKMYAAYFLVVPYFMLRVKRAVLSGAHGLNLTSVWRVFLGYQAFRCVAWVARVATLQVRSFSQVEALEVP